MIENTVIESTALVPVGQMTIQEIMTIGETMAKSGFFSDAKDANKAVVKILAGREMGFGPFAAMSGIHIIKGKPTIGANLMAAAVKGHPRYDYRVVQMTAEVCEIAYLEGGQELGRSLFTKQDAQAAGTQNMGKFPRNMLFARAMSNGVKWFCPDVFLGAPAYTPEELGAQVNADGEILDLTPTVTRPSETTTTTTTTQPGGDVDNGATNGDSKEKGFCLSADAMAALTTGDNPLADGPPNAATMVNLSAILDNTSTTDEIVAWATIYRAARDEGAGTVKAAKQADAQVSVEAGTAAGDE